MTWCLYMNDSMGCADLMWTSLSKILPATALLSQVKMCLSDMWICVCASAQSIHIHVRGCVKFTCEDKGLICTWLKHLLALLCQAFCLEKLLLGFRGCVASKELLKSLSFWSLGVRSFYWERGRGSHGKVMHVSSNTWVPAQWNSG